MGPCTHYGSSQAPNSRPTARRAHVLRAPSKTTTVWSGEYIELDLPLDCLDSNSMLALEPRSDSHTRDTHHGNFRWPPPTLVHSVAGRVRIPNLTDEPVILKRKEHFCQVSAVFTPKPDDTPQMDTFATP